MNGYQFSGAIYISMILLGIAFGLIFGFFIPSQDILIIFLSFCIGAVTFTLIIAWKKIKIYEDYLKKLELDN